MAAILEPKVTAAQALIVPPGPRTIARMGKKIENEQEKQSFAERLNQLLDERGIPRENEGRQTALAKLMGLSQKGVRKWVVGEGFPTMANVVRMAKLFNVRVEWLLSGRGPKHIEPAEPASIIDLPNGLRRETIDFIEFRLQREMTGEQLARYLKWLDHMRSNLPGKVQ